MTQISKAQQERQSSMGFLIQLLARRIDGEMKQRLSEIGVDLKTFSNLMLLSERDGHTQRELGKMLEFPEYDTSRTVDALVESGFAERRPDPNSRRSVLVFLTEKGRKKAAELPGIISSLNVSLLKTLSDDERKQLIRLLQKLADLEKRHPVSTSEPGF